MWIAREMRDGEKHGLSKTERGKAMAASGMTWQGSGKALLSAVTHRYSGSLLGIGEVSIRIVSWWL